MSPSMKRRTLVWLTAALFGCSGGGSQRDSESDGEDSDEPVADAASPGADEDSGRSGDGDGGTLDDAGCKEPGKGCPVESKPACGDGLINVAGETCDDGNGASGDGCTANCLIEANYVCPAPGMACKSTVRCDDGKVTGDETCDDGNHEPNDGCSDTCQLEPGWVCPTAAARCEAAACGDGIVAGFEECDFVSSTSGCSGCLISDGYDCDASGCAPTECGNGKVERNEQCEDGNDVPFDGCYQCKHEPVCSEGMCEAVCGDGQRYSNEDCDDGNTRDGDGCSASCHTELGYACEDRPGEPPPSVALPIIFRDFIGQGNSLRDTASCYDPVFEQPSNDKPIPCFHINFNGLTSSVPGGALADELGADGRPVYVCEEAGCTDNPAQTGQTNSNVGATNNRDNFTGPEDFANWYDSSYAQALEIVGALTLVRETSGLLSGSYVFHGAGAFYPLDGLGWVARGEESVASSGCQHNVSFTSETHFWFEYQGGERFTFDGDDDMWVFVNGHLVIDLGGLHGSMRSTFVLDADSDGTGPDTADGTVDANTAVDPQDQNKQPRSDYALGLVPGGVYEVVMFHAERNECGSNFSVTLKDFNRPKSECSSTCGDGKVASDELCDDGQDNATENPPPYGRCGSDCRSRGGFCGDGKVDQDAGEACDDGVNLSVYGPVGCAPGCKLPASCGDGVVQGKFEECDDGENLGGYGKCAAGCVLGPYCGDGQKQGDEECDDGNRSNNDACSINCELEVVL